LHDYAADDIILRLPPGAYGCYRDDISPMLFGFRHEFRCRASAIFAAVI